MKSNIAKTYIIWIAISEAVGLFAALLTTGSMEIYRMTINKPIFAPPAIVFPIVWSVLYALMGISAARVSMTPPSPARSIGLNLFVAQLIVNFFWSLIFFRAMAFGFAFFWLILLWILVFFMIWFFNKVDKPAALLQIPYLTWLTFAAFLSYSVWKMN